ncbi:g7700 [Coccomyxa elongata]
MSIPLHTRIEALGARRRRNRIALNAYASGGGQGGCDTDPPNAKSTAQDEPSRANQQQPLLGKPSSRYLVEIFKASALSVALYTMGTNVKAGLNGIGQGLNGIGPGLSGIGQGLNCIGQGPHCQAPPLTEVLGLGVKTVEHVAPPLSMQ